ncbi:MAG: YIP1 family protein [Desulfobacterales bacterium]|nr:YIP1 family protein [Desulfobacterales bacterium]
MDALGDYGTSSDFPGCRGPLPSCGHCPDLPDKPHPSPPADRGGGREKGFEASLRAVCYSQATQLWALIPYVGALVATLWLVVVQVIGLREIHEVSYARVLDRFSDPCGACRCGAHGCGVSLF